MIKYIVLSLTLIFVVSGNSQAQSQMSVTFPTVGAGPEPEAAIEYATSKGILVPAHREACVAKGKKFHLQCGAKGAPQVNKFIPLETDTTVIDGADYYAVMLYFTGLCNCT